MRRVLPGFVVWLALLLMPFDGGSALRAAEDPFLGRDGELLPNPIVDLFFGNPQDLVEGDFNEDGTIDLVAVGQSTSVVLLGNGDCTFGRNGFATSGGSRGAVADFDEDGNQDLAISTGLELQIRLGNGDGTFAGPLVLTSPPLSFFSFGLAAADFNEDGNVDLLTGFYQGEPLTFFAGNGDGTFDPPTSFGFQSSLDFGVADFNGDDHLDFVVGIISPRLYLGNGDGTFVADAVLPAGDSAEAYVVSDFNDDGNMDFATSNSVSEDVTVRLGNGDGTFAAPASYPVGRLPQTLTVTDLDQDGVEDLLTGSRFPRERYLSMLRGNSDGTFQAEVRTTIVHSPGPVVAADFDGDGPLDLAVASSAWDEMFVARGHGDGTFMGAEPQTIRSAGVGLTFDSAFGDLNNDGLQDVALLSDDGVTPIAVLLADGTGAFTVSATTTAGTDPTDIVLADLDGNTFLDVIVANTGDNTLTVSLAQGAGLFDPPFSVPSGRDPVSLVSGQFSADTIVDLAVLNTDPFPIVRVLVGNGDGTFGFGSTLTVGATTSQIHSGDVDANGIQDLIAFAPDSQELTLFLGSGAGAFQVGVTYPLPAGFGQETLQLIDANDDGNVDLVLPYPNRVALFGAGDGTFAAPSSIGIDSITDAFASADLDGDGRAELIAGYRQVRVQKRQVDGTLTQPSFFASDNVDRILIDDTNQDGRNDVVTVHGDGITALLNVDAPAFNFLNDKTTLRWPQIGVADSYNIYRGPLSALTDLDSDGLPDTGYGDCQNALDPDTTDVVFVDVSVPAPGAGYFYLISYREGSLERLLGFTSDGLARVPSTPCP